MFHVTNLNFAGVFSVSENGLARTGPHETHECPSQNQSQNRVGHIWNLRHVWNRNCVVQAEESIVTHVFFFKLLEVGCPGLENVLEQIYKFNIDYE